MSEQKSMGEAILDGTIKGPNWPIIHEETIEAGIISHQPGKVYMPRAVLGLATDLPCIVTDYQQPADEQEMPALFGEDLASINPATRPDYEFWADDMEYPTASGWRPVRSTNG